MSLILSNEKNKLDARYSITFFYFMLASIQYLITVIIFKNSFIYPFELLSFFIIIFGIILGNLFIIHVSENIYKLLINFLALVSSIILIISWPLLFYDFKISKIFCIPLFFFGKTSFNSICLLLSIFLFWKLASLIKWINSSIFLATLDISFSIIFRLNPFFIKNSS